MNDHFVGANKLIGKMRKLKADMIEVAEELDALGFEQSVELVGAASILQTWIDGLGDEAAR